jgi:hypothetical protein
VPRQQKDDAQESPGGLVSLAALALVAEAGGVRGRTIESTPWHVVGLGLEGGRLFWTLDRCTDTYTRPLAGGKPVLLGNAASQACDFVERPDVAYGRGRAVWSARGAGNFVYEDVMVGARGERPKLLEQVVGASGGGDGEYLIGIAAGDSTIVYSVVSVGRSDTCIDPGTPCDYFIRSARTMRVAGRRAVRVPGVPAVVRLAAGGGRIAVDVAADPDGTKFVRAGRIEVRDAASGRRTASVPTTGDVLELALSKDVLAVLVRSSGRKAIERYAPNGGRLLGRTQVYGNARGLAVSGRRIVFLTGRAVRQVGRGLVAVAATPPVAVAIEGRSVAWAETAGRKGRIVLAEL